MSAITIGQMADRVLRLIDPGAAANPGRLHQAARHLPRGARRAARRLAAAQDRARDPKLLLQIDEGAVAADYHLLLRHLGGRSVRLRQLRQALREAIVVSLVLLGGVTAWIVLSAQ